MLTTPAFRCVFGRIFFFFFWFLHIYTNVVECLMLQVEHNKHVCTYNMVFFFFFFLIIYNDELLKERRWLAVVRRCVVMMIDVGVCLIRGGVQDRRAGQRKHKKQEKKENRTISELGSGGCSELIFYVKSRTFDRFVTRKRFRRRIIYSKKRDTLRCIYSVYFLYNHLLGIFRILLFRV